MAEKNDNRMWYLRTGGSNVYGPVSTSTLLQWAEQGRVLPGHEVSQDQKDWSSAESVPELAMNVYIDMGNGNLGGPFNRIAAETLLKSGRVPAGSKLLTNTESSEEPEEVAEEEPDEEPKEEPVQEAGPSEAELALQEKVKSLESLVARQQHQIRELEKFSASLKEAEQERDALREKIRTNNAAHEQEMQNLQQEISERDAKILSLESEIDDLNAKIEKANEDFAELLKASNERDLEARKKQAELEKSCSLPPEAIRKFQMDQAAVYALVKEEADTLSQSLEDEHGYLERLKALAIERQQTMLDHRRKYLRILGSSPVDMTQRTLRNQPYDSQVVNLRAQLENQNLAAQREKQLYDTRENELLQRIKQLESEAAHLTEQLGKAEKTQSDIQSVRELLHQREQELNEMRRDRNDEQEQFRASQSALLARIETLERRASEPPSFSRPDIPPIPEETDHV